MNFYSVERESAVGRELADELENSSRIVDDPEIAEYINRLGQNLVRSSDAKVPFVIKVIDLEEVNAMALPGGFSLRQHRLDSGGERRSRACRCHGSRDCSCRCAA